MTDPSVDAGPKELASSKWPLPSDAGCSEPPHQEVAPDNATERVPGTDAASECEVPRSSQPVPWAWAGTSLDLQAPGGSRKGNATNNTTTTGNWTGATTSVSSHQTGELFFEPLSEMDEQLQEDIAEAITSDNLFSFLLKFCSEDPTRQTPSTSLHDDARRHADSGYVTELRSSGDTFSQAPRGQGGYTEVPCRPFASGKVSADKALMQKAMNFVWSAQPEEEKPQRISNYSTWTAYLKGYTHISRTGRTPLR